MSVSKKKQVAIVWANPYNKNLGVGALAYSSLAIFHDIIKENNINAEISFLGSSKWTPDSVIIGGDKMSFNNIVGMDYLNWKAIIKMMLRPRRFRLNKVLGLDYIFDMSEGDSFTDIYGDGRFYRIFNSKKIFSIMGKTQVLLPQTIGPFNNPSREKSAIAVMKKINTVISRDKKSFNYTQQFLPKENIAEMIDVAFYMPFEHKKFNNNKINVGINISGLLWNGGYTGKNQFNLKTDYKKLIRDTLNYFAAQENVQIHLVPHVIPTDSPVEDDYTASEEIQKEFPQVVVSPRFDSPIEAKSYISGMDFFTGARMHACIAAFSSGVPVYPMAYSRKFNGLFGDTLKYKWMGDCVNETGDEVFSKLKEGYVKRDLLASQIADSNENIVKPRLRQLKELLAKTLLN